MVPLVAVAPCYSPTLLLINLIKTTKYANFIHVQTIKIICNHNTMEISITISKYINTYSFLLQKYPQK
jgi:hypothetical protein